MPRPGVASQATAPLVLPGRCTRFEISVDFSALLLARPLTRERLLGASPIAGLQVEGVLLDILDDIFLLHLPLEPAKRAFDGLAILHFHFSRAKKHPLYGRLPGSLGTTWCSLAPFRRSEERRVGKECRSR